MSLHQFQDDETDLVRACRVCTSSPLFKFFRSCILDANMPRSLQVMCFLLPWGCTPHDELVYHPAHPISRFKLPTVSECKAGLQGSGVLFFFFLASGGTLLISSDYVPPKTLDLHDCHFIKTSRHHVKTILFRRIRHSKSHFPRLLQRNLHARQLL